MKYSVDIDETSFEGRQLADLLSALGMEVASGYETQQGFTAPHFDLLESGEIWDRARAVRDSIMAAERGAVFKLGGVVEWKESRPTVNRYLEVQSSLHLMTSGRAVLTAGRPDGVSEEEWQRREAERLELAYQLELAPLVDRAVAHKNNGDAQRVIKLLDQNEPHTGTSLYKIFELIRKDLRGTATVDQYVRGGKKQLDRFTRSVQHPETFGDGSRHADMREPPPDNPMSLKEAERFTRDVAARWLANVAKRHAKAGSL